MLQLLHLSSPVVLLLLPLGRQRELPWLHLGSWKWQQLEWTWGRQSSQMAGLMVLDRSGRAGGRMGPRRTPAGERVAQQGGRCGRLQLFCGHLAVELAAQMLWVIAMVVELIVQQGGRAICL